MAASSAPQELNTEDKAHICHFTGLDGNTKGVVSHKEVNNNAFVNENLHKKPWHM